MSDLTTIILTTAESRALNKLMTDHPSIPAADIVRYSLRLVITKGPVVSIGRYETDSRWYDCLQEGIPRKYTRKEWDTGIRRKSFRLSETDLQQVEVITKKYKLNTTCAISLSLRNLSWLQLSRDEAVKDLKDYVKRRDSIDAEDTCSLTVHLTTDVYTNLLKLADSKSMNLQTLVTKILNKVGS